MSHKEQEITIRAKYDPDLTSFVKKTRKDYWDVTTGELIPKGSPCHELKFREGPNLVTKRVSVETYQRLQEEAANA